MMHANTLKLDMKSTKIYITDLKARKEKPHTRKQDTNAVISIHWTAHLKASKKRNYHGQLQDYAIHSVKNVKKN